MNLTQIYNELGSVLGWTEHECTQAAKYECEIERALVYAIPSTKALIETARTQGRQMAFLSDMYLPEAFIRGELSRIGCLEDEDICLVSSEYGRSKRDGCLFRSLLEEFELDPSLMTHTGDNHLADVCSPRKIGIHSTHLTDSNLNRFERILESYSQTTDGLSSLMAGASRYARLRTAVSSASESALRDVAAGVMSPTLVGYVLWILQRAQKKHLTKLYFVSRDGQILKTIAEAVTAKLGLNIECKYLYGSRQAWHLPGIERFADREFEWMLASSDHLTVRGILSRVGLQPEAFANPLSLLGFDRAQYDRQLSESEKESIRPLFDRAEMHDAILKQSAQARHLLLDYLDQEGLLASSHAGIVEIGWYGRTRASLNAVLRSCGHKPLPFFYFGLFNTIDHLSGPWESYLFDGHHGTGHLAETLPEVWTIMETFCAADHGMTVGYARENGTIRPILRQERNAKVLDWGLRIVRRTVSNFTEALLLDSELVDWQADLRQVTIDLLKTWWLTPTRDEAHAWGRFPYEDDQSGQTWQCLAVPYRSTDVLKTIVFGAPSHRHRGWSWIHGSLQQSSFVNRSVVRAVLQVRRYSLRCAARIRTLADRNRDAFHRKVRLHSSEKLTRDAVDSGRDDNGGNRR